jgi:hypothetical protein
MRKIVILLSVVVFGLSVTSHAGFDPSPFHEEINKLKSIENNMSSLGRRLHRLLEDPPDTFSPHGDLKSAVKKLSAIAHKLEVLDRRMIDIMDITAYLHMESPSEPLQPMILAAKDVQVKAQMMENMIGAYVEATLPDQIPPEFIDALGAIERRVAPIPLKLDIDYFAYQVKRTIPVRFVQHVDFASDALIDEELQAALNRTNNIFRPAGIQFVMSYNIVVEHSDFRNLFWFYDPDDDVPYHWPLDPNTSDAIWPLLWPDRAECPELYIPEHNHPTYFWETTYHAQMRAGTYCGRPEEILVYINEGKSNGGQYPWYSRIIGMTREHMLTDTFPHEVGHYLGLPHTFPGLEVYGLGYNFGRLIGAADKPDPTQIYRYYKPTDRVLDPETEEIAPFSMFWDLIFSTGNDTGRKFFDSRESAAVYEPTLQPIEQWHNGVLCRPYDPLCESSPVTRLKLSVAAGCIGPDGSTSNCEFSAQDYYTGEQEVAAFSRFGSIPDRIRWNIMSYGYNWADGTRVDSSIIESQFISKSQVEQVKRVLRRGNDVETYYFEGQMGLRPHLGVCFRCHYHPAKE